MYEKYRSDRLYDNKGKVKVVEKVLNYELRGVNWRPLIKFLNIF